MAAAPGGGYQYQSGGNQLGGFVQHLEPGLLGAATGGVGHRFTSCAKAVLLSQRRQLQRRPSVLAALPIKERTARWHYLAALAETTAPAQHRGPPDQIHRPQGRPHQR